MLNLSSILHSTDVINTIPSIAKKFTSTVVYTLNPPISQKIYNFNKFVGSLNVESFIQNNSILPCQCSNSSFSDKNHGHIISGDLRLIKNNKMRKLFSKCPKYRENKFLDWNLVEETILESVKNCAELWCKKNKKNEKVLKMWITTVSKKVRTKIETLKTSHPAKPVHEVLKNRDCSSSLEELKDRFIIVPIDKAMGNVTFICKRFLCTGFLFQEFGLDDQASSAAYESKEQENH